MSAKTLAEHAADVADVALQVKGYATAGQLVHIAKGGVHHVVPLPGDERFALPPVDVSRLSSVIAIDAASRTCTAEPGVTFAALLDITLPLGLIPRLVPELEDITIGGAVAGCSVESMSYRYGGFHDGCLEYEIVTAAGDVMTCSRTDEPFVFEMVHGSYGTLAILTLLTFELVPAKPFVQLDYEHYTDFKIFETALLARCEGGDHDFVDAIVHASDDLVLCIGSFVDDAPYVSDYRHENIYYKSARDRDDDYLTTRDYCFRYDTECHWMTRMIPPLEWPWVRRAVGRWFLGSTNLITWTRRLDRVLRLKRRPEVVCDVFIPATRFGEFFEWYIRDFEFFPLWVIPYRVHAPYPWVNADRVARWDTDLMIDCAVYGKPNNDRDVDASKELENETFRLDGIKTLISRNHYDESRFWDTYNRQNYDTAKARLDPHGVFRGLYEKLGRVE